MQVFVCSFLLTFSRLEVIQHFTFLKLYVFVQRTVGCVDARTNFSTTALRRQPCTSPCSHALKGGLWDGSVIGLHGSSKW